MMITVITWLDLRWHGLLTRLWHHDESREASGMLWHLLLASAIRCDRRDRDRAIREGWQG